MTMNTRRSTDRRGSLGGMTRVRKTVPRPQSTVSRWLVAVALGTPAWVGCATIRPVDDVIRIGAPVDAVSSAEAPLAEEAVPSAMDAPSVLPPRTELRAYSDGALQEYDRVCRDLLESARAAEADYDQLMEAARALAFNADLRIQSYLAFCVDPADLPAPEAMIDAEDGVSDELKGEVRSLAKSSKDLADRALEMRADDPGAWLFSTLGAGLFLWSLGPIEALTSGGATSLPKKIKALADAHPAFEGASSLRLKGRFQSRAPWPYRDKPGGVETLEKAVEIAPIPLNLLFLGDAYWINGQEDDAVDAWERATRADADQETMIAAPLLREISRLRVISARR